MTERFKKAHLTFNEFRRVLADILEVEEERLTPEASFLNDLLVDSIRLVDALVRLEESGIAIPLEAAWEVDTVGDAYRVYSEQPGWRFSPPVVSH